VSRKAAHPAQPPLHRKPNKAGPSHRKPLPIDARIQGALEIMRSTCEASLTASGMAARLGLSRSRFEHLLHEQTGKTFGGTLSDFRLAKARALLADCTRRIKEIASLCAYSSTAGFTKAFRRRFGKSPSNYRRSTFGQEIAHRDSELGLKH